MFAIKVTLTGCLMLAVLAVQTAFAAGQEPVRETAMRAAIVSPGTEPKAAHADERIRVVRYDADATVRLRAAFGFVLAVEFAQDERVLSVSLGDSVAWQVIPRDNLLFIKPQEDKPETNMLVQTTHRSYTFALLAFRPGSIGDSRLTYRVRFRYPDDEARLLAVQQQAVTSAASREVRSMAGGQFALELGAQPGGLAQARSKLPSQWNFRYSFKGSRSAAPLQILDDGEFTYVRFANYENVPAVFLVDDRKNETLANFRREGEWLVIEKVARQLAFRSANNTEITCVFNDAFPVRPDSSLRER